MRTIWAICTKIGQKGSRIGGKKYQASWWINPFYMIEILFYTWTLAWDPSQAGASAEIAQAWGPKLPLRCSSDLPQTRITKTLPAGSAACPWKGRLRLPDAGGWLLMQADACEIRAWCAGWPEGPGRIYTYCCQWSLLVKHLLMQHYIILVRVTLQTSTKIY